MRMNAEVKTFIQLLVLNWIFEVLKYDHRHLPFRQIFKDLNCPLCFEFKTYLRENGLGLKASISQGVF